MKRIYFAFILAVTAAYAPAPILDQRTGIKPQAEHTQDQIAAQQQHQHKIGEMGSSPADTEPNLRIDGRSSGDAGAALRAGTESMGNSDSEKAAAALKAAAKAKAAKSSPNYFWLAIIACVLGFGAVAGLRAWVNKAIPVPTDPKRYRL